MSMRNGEHQISRCVRLIVRLALLALVAAVPQLHAAEHEDFDSYKLRVDGFWFYSNPTGSVTAAGNNGSFDINKDFHFNSYSTFTGRVDWKFTRKNHLYFIGTDFDQSKQVTLNRTIIFRGQTFAVNSTASGELTSLVLIPGYQYDIIRRKRGHFGVQAQLNIFDVTGSIKAAAQVNNGVPQSAQVSSGSLRAPLPVAGPDFRYYLTNSPRLFVTGNVLGMYFFGYGNYVSSTGTVGVTINKHMNIQGGYQLGSRFQVNVNSNRVGLDLSQKGAVVGAEFSL
jgi:hypothetical protein